MDIICYKGSIITEGQKEKSQLFFTKELFEGDVSKKAPLSLRKKMSAEIMENIETSIVSFYSAPCNSKMVFQSYSHFRRTLDELGISLKRYLK